VQEELCEQQEAQKHAEEQHLQVEAKSRAEEQVFIFIFIHLDIYFVILLYKFIFCLLFICFVNLISHIYFTFTS
jgi:hypothetical protein